MPQQSPFTREQMDAAAVKRGYRNYAHMIYVMQNRLPQPKIPGEAAPKNFLQQLFDDPRQAIADAMAWHPKNTIGRTAEKVREARQR